MNDLNNALQSKYPHLELSVLKLSEVERDNESKRIDSEYFKREYVENEELIKQIKYEIFGNLIKNICNGDDCREYVEDGITYIRTGDIQEYGLNLDSTEKVSSSFNFKRKLSKSDLLITRKGNYGKSTIVFDKEVLQSAISSEIFQIKLKDINPFYVDIFLKTKFGQLQFEKHIHGVSNFSITQEALQTFLIPLMSKEFQLEIESLVKDSHKALESSKALYKEAEELLYKELGLDSKNPLSSLSQGDKTNLSEIKHPNLNISIKSLKQSFLKTGRLDSEYYQAKYELIENLIQNFKYEKLGNLVDFTKSIEPGSEAYKTSEIGKDGIEFARVANLSKFGLSKSEIYLLRKDFENESLKPKKDSVLLSKDGSVGISYCVNEDMDCITSGAILHLKIKEMFKGQILPRYLSLVLNSIVVKLQSERDCGGSIIAHWRVDEIKNVLIPLLNLTTQEAIEAKIKQSFNLRAESKELLERAKQMVENEIVKDKIC